MTENASHVPNEDQQRVEEIHSEIRELQEGTKNPDAFAKGGTLAPKLKGLIGLGAAVASIVRDAVRCFRKPILKVDRQLKPS